MRRVNTYGNDKISTASTMFDFKPMKGGTAYHKAPDLGMDPLLAGSVKSNGNQNDQPAGHPVAEGHRMPCLGREAAQVPKTSVSWGNAHFGG